MQFGAHSGVPPPRKLPPRTTTSLPVQLPPGAVLLGNYRLDAVLGSGPGGMVYNAWDLSRGRPCALKVLSPELRELTAELVRLRHDNQEIGSLHHPHLLASELRYTGDGQPVLLRELWRGESLRQRLRGGPLPLGEVGRLFVVLCGALEAVHRHGVVHGDLKPENLLFGRQPDGPAPEQLLLLDFGMHHLRPGEIETRSYLAPEQIEGDPMDVEGRADVFALGAILYECVTGAAAFAAPQAAAVIGKICHGDPPKATPARPGLPAALDLVLELACARLPDERFSSAAALWVALRGALQGVEDFDEALGQIAAPSAASSTAVLLPAPASTASMIRSRAPARRVNNLRPRRSNNGARAVRLFKALEASARHSRDEPSLEIRRSAAEEAARILDSADIRRVDEEGRRAAALWAAQEKERQAAERALQQGAPWPGEPEEPEEIGPGPGPPALTSADTMPAYRMTSADTMPAYRMTSADTMPRYLPEAPAAPPPPPPRLPQTMEVAPVGALPLGPAPSPGHGQRLAVVAFVALLAGALLALLVH